MGRPRTHVQLLLLLALAVFNAPDYAGAGGRRGKRTPIFAQTDIETSKPLRQGAELAAQYGADNNICFFSVSGGGNEFVPSLFFGDDVPRAVRFGSGKFHYDRTKRESRQAFYNHRTHKIRSGRVSEEQAQFCDAFIGLWQIPMVGSLGFIEKAGADPRKWLPFNIEHKTVVVGYVEDCTKAAAVRGAIDAVWYHNALADPASLLNLPLGPTHSMKFTPERTAMKHAASKRKYFYNIVVSTSTGRVGMHTSKRAKWIRAHMHWRQELANAHELHETAVALALSKAEAARMAPRHSYCSFSAITTKWEKPNSKNDRWTPTEPGNTEGGVADAHHAVSLRPGNGRGLRSLPDTQPVSAANVHSSTVGGTEETLGARVRRESNYRDTELPPCPMVQSHGKISQQEYSNVLLDSVFTLSPAGHNIECFRMWEAAEAGSIPVLLVNESSVGGGEVNETGCSLHPDVMKAPFIWAETLDDAWVQMRTLGNDKAALNARSRAVRAWYESYMKIQMQRFERLLDDAVRRGKDTTPRRAEVEREPIATQVTASDALEALEALEERESVRTELKAALELTHEKGEKTRRKKKRKHREPSGNVATPWKTGSL